MGVVFASQRRLVGKPCLVLVVENHCDDRTNSTNGMKEKENQRASRNVKGKKMIRGKDERFKDRVKKNCQLRVRRTMDSQLCGSYHEISLVIS